MTDSKVHFTKETTVDELLDYAKDEVQNVESGKEFIVKKLFLEDDWNRIKVKRLLGLKFSYYAKGLGKDQIKPEGKTPQNQQIYKKL